VFSKKEKVVKGNTDKYIFLFWLCFGMLLVHTKPLKAEDYIIGAEDVLSISVWETENLNLNAPVRPDGKISFPLLDDLQAAGLTPLQLKEELTKKLRRFFKDPVVTVIVKEVISPKVYIQGQVNRPGTYILKKSSTILELLSDAGGVTETANLQSAYLLRNGKKASVDFYKLLEKGDTSQNISLLPGDNIFIPGGFANRITVVGEVNNPQTIPFQEGLTVLDAILAAGGLTKHADPDDTTIIRKDKIKAKKIKVDMEAVIDDGEFEQNILLVPGDVVIVGESWF
jgi:polysaccharide export outer membrane protein